MADELESLRIRSKYRGNTSVDRLRKDKLDSLHQAMNNSYQSQTIEYENNKYKCLINPNRLKPDYDEKILSIPFSEKVEGKNTVFAHNLHGGSIYSWVEDGNSKWIVHLVHSEESSYFRAEVKRCRYQIELKNGSKYWAYVRGPVETKINWDTRRSLQWNNMNETTFIIIPYTEETLAYFERFSYIKINGRKWQVQAVDNLSTPGVIEMTAKEDFSNPYKDDEEAREKEQEQPVIPKPLTEPQILGPTKVKYYDVSKYSYINYPDGGTWLVSNSRARILKAEGRTVEIEFATRNAGKVILAYRVPGQNDLRLEIEVTSI